MRIKANFNLIIKKYQYAKLVFGFYFGKLDYLTPRFILKIPIPFMKNYHGILYYHQFDKFRII